MPKSIVPELPRPIAKGKGVITDLIRLIYPPLCLSCGAETTSEQGLCAKCWPETQFITGAICDCCGTPLSGLDAEDGLICDTCTTTPQAWARGRAAVVYDGGGRRIAMALKHGDRLDVVKPVARWMVRSGDAVINTADLIAPVPLHWSRLLHRKFNQAAELGREVGRLSNIRHCPDLLTRNKRTKMQKGMRRAERFENQRDAITLTPRYGGQLGGKNVLLIDDVLTTGATLSACAEACYADGAETVNVLVFARVARTE